jgi:hypothetical protein
MKQQTAVTENKSGYVRARLTTAEQTRVKERARMLGMTVSEWTRMTLISALEASESEQRLMTFIAAETAAIRLSLEEWQQGRHLTEPDVQQRIERLSIAAGLERAKATVSKLDIARRENGEAA